LTYPKYLHIEKRIPELAASKDIVDVIHNVGPFLGDIFGEIPRQCGGALADLACFLRYVKTGTFIA
jgi:hypothetical protein